MSSDNTNPEEKTAQEKADEKAALEMQRMKDKYEQRGIKQVSYADYIALQEKAAKKGKFKIPPQLKLILGTPFIIIFCFGVLFIPFMLYSIATSPSAPPIQDEASADKAYDREAKNR